MSIDKQSSTPIWETIAQRTERIYHEIRQDQQDYRESAAEAAAAGHRPSRCFHGTLLWTEYDLPCPGCESNGLDQHSGPAQVREYAAAQARREARWDIAADEATAYAVKFIAEANGESYDQALSYLTRRS